ncbi:hypothetical protein XCR1_1560016 [Xenorhabdus cabanillasii JM26]|uniref:Uncharacterized protein n=1 Tax=Xenorhabdus cabanillasii JM26 TaxID=1427517 RepID=W1IQI9_9GAMM|nr:hypothetical protein XCR1_1560016 [Xenorhabdus cabanillasii JM26]
MIIKESNQLPASHNYRQLSDNIKISSIISNSKVMAELTQCITSGFYIRRTV